MQQEIIAKMDMIQEAIMTALHLQKMDLKNVSNIIMKYSIQNNK